MRHTSLVYSREVISGQALPASSSTATPVNIPSPGAVQRTDPTKSDVSVRGNNSSMYRASCPLASGARGRLQLRRRLAFAEASSRVSRRVLIPVAGGDVALVRTNQPTGIGIARNAAGDVAGSNLSGVEPDQPAGEIGSLHIDIDHPHVPDTGGGIAEQTYENYVVRIDKQVADGP